MTSQTEIATVLRAWRIGPARSIEPLGSGSNNENWTVEASDGTYVLRIYRNVGAAAGIAFEHRLLSALDKAGLPFAVPVPIPGETGATVVETSLGAASLTKRIPGRHANSGDLIDAGAAGVGLGELDKALASIQVDQPFPSVSGYGDLWKVHPVVMGPGDALALLGWAGPDRARYEQALESTELAWPGLMESLPTQVIHSDYGWTNVLLVGGAVSGVLDFEFSAPDLRAMDLAVGLYSFCLTGGTGPNDANAWASLRAFFNGFSETMTLSTAELAALPILLLRRQLVVALHWLGRWKVGLSSEQETRERLARLTELQKWLSEEGHEIVARLCER